MIAVRLRMIQKTVTQNLDLYLPTCGSKEKHMHKYIEKYNKQERKKEKQSNNKKQ